MSNKDKISNGDYERVGEVPFGYQFVSDAQDVEPLNAEFGQTYDAYFVKIGEGEYDKVYGMEGIVPTSNKRVWRVK